MRGRYTTNDHVSRILQRDPHILMHYLVVRSFPFIPFNMLDYHLSGGIEAGSITEIVAESNSGKLELCHTLAVTCQLPVYMGGGGTGCLYIDAEDTFQPQRLISIADRYRLNRQDVLDNVGYVKALNLGVDQQTSLLTTAVALMCEKRYVESFYHYTCIDLCRYSVLIIDSWTALFRSFYSAPYMLPAHKSHITMFSRVLQRLAAEVCHGYFACPPLICDILFFISMKLRLSSPIKSHQILNLLEVTLLVT